MPHSLPRPAARRGLALALLVVLAVAFARPTAAQASNDTWLPRDDAAEEALLRGDQAWIARGEDPAARREALEAWYGALSRSAPGAAVRLDLSPLAAQPLAEPWPAPAGAAAERRSESVAVAVRRRLVQAGPRTCAAWRERFGALAEAAASGPLPADWRRASRDHPGTRGGFRGALRLAEGALEEGRRLGATTWLDRAEAHLALGAGGEAEREALAVRRAAVRRTLGAWAPPDEGSLLRGAKGFELRHGVSLRFHLGGRPGHARLDDGQLLVQGRGFDQGRDAVYETVGDGLARAFEPWHLLEEHGLPQTEVVGHPGRAWDYTPIADGEELLLVLGRAEEFGGVDERSNAVARLTPPRGATGGELHWALGPGGLWTQEAGRVATLAELLAPGLWEFQPEASLLDDRLLLQARLWMQEEDERGRLRLRARGEARAFALALDRRDGSLLWLRELGRGSEPRSDVGLPSAATRRARTPAPPPVAVDGNAVFFASQLGVGALLDAEDGRLLWAFRNPRREAEDPGWSPLPPPRAVEGPEDGPRTVVWAPADGDRLHWLRGAPDLDGGGLRVHPPLPIGECEALLGADGREALLLARYGPRATLAAYRPATGERRDALDLAPDEEPVLDLLWSEDRALLATERALYLFDRGRDLYLLEALPLPPGTADDAARLAAHGGAVELLAPGGLWTFAVVR